ncbi:MAG: serine hydrolase [Gemmatimonadota bacterium]|nr:serine hydrolase [Gemmatimonadota bacterium]
MRTRTTASGTILALAALSLPASLPGQGIDPLTVDTTVEEIRERTGIPGVAVAIVQGDSVVLARGWGVREAGAGAPVDAGTLFAIGSATKAFTAATVGAVVDDGLLGWDDRAIDHLPGFALHDPYATAGITVRDLLAHRSGLPRGDLMWLTKRLPADTLIHRLRHLEPAAGFRARFTYQNGLYLAAGRIVEEASGEPWEAVLHERILEPLGMSRTTASVDSLTGLTNVATPHVRVDGEAVAVPYRNLDHVAPAGAIHSSASDLARWLRFLVSGGAVDGKAVIGAATLAETYTPQIVVPMDPVMRALHPAANLLAYGLGWFVSDFHGRTLVAHGGGIDGMTSVVAWVPEEDLGVAVLANLQTPTPPVWVYGILYGILDPALGVGRTDWEAPARELEAVYRRMIQEAAPERIEGTEPSFPLEAYAGTWASETLGEAEVAIEAGRLVFRAGTLEGTLEPWHRDTFRAGWQDPAFRAAAGAGWITFRMGRTGRIAELELVAIPGERERLERAPADR